MKCSLSLYLLFLFFTPSSHAQDESVLLKEITRNIIQGIKEFNTPIDNLECSINPLDFNKKSCSAITDNFCKELWNDKNSGNIKVFDGEILAGKSPMTGIDLSTLANDNALVSSIDRLPEDAKKHLSPSVERLSKLLKNETKSPMWYFDYTKIKMAIKSAMEKLATERFEKNTNIKVEDDKVWTVDETIKYQTETRKVFDEITYAKYKLHPNWLRVETAYAKAKDLLLKNIESLDIPLEKRNELKTKVTSVELTLPSLDPKLMGSKECASTEVNAYYSAAANKFTVCAGCFNRYLSESSLVFIIAHEISHSVDSEQQARDQWRKEASIPKKLNSLINSKNQTYSCNEWKSLNEKVFTLPSDFKNKKSPFDNLYNCLRGESKNGDSDLSNLLFVVQKQVKTEIKKQVDLNVFSMLLDKNKLVEDKVVPNEAYYRPDIQKAGWLGHYEESKNRNVDNTEIFMQSFYCLLEDNKLTKDEFESVPEKLRSSIVEKAIEQTTKIKVADALEYYRYCGKNCSGLMSDNLAVDISENTADWLAVKSFPDYLKNILPENREQASALSTSLFCTKNLDDSDLTSEEKTFALKKHPEGRHRRISLYSPETSSLLGCKVQVGEEGDSKCKP